METERILTLIEQHRQLEKQKQQLLIQFILPLEEQVAQVEQELLELGVTGQIFTHESCQGQAVETETGFYCLNCGAAGERESHSAGQGL